MATTKRRRLELIFFEHERIVRLVSGHCPVCQVNSEGLTPQQAGDLARVDLQRIYQWLAQGRVHLVVTSDGEERVCRKSLGV
jgi:hypothetical protein